MKHLIAGIIPTMGAAMVAAIGIAFGVVSLAHAAPAATVYVPSANTIVEVTGDKLHGFGVYYYDGTSIFPPTDSEARAECAGYDTEAARVRCRTEVRTWYRDLTALKKALNWAQATN